MSSCVLNTEQLKPWVTRVFMLYLLTLLLSVFFSFPLDNVWRHSSSLRHSFWCFCLNPSLSLVSFGWGIVILQIQYICITIAPNVLFMWLRVLYLKNNYIFPPLLKTLYLKQPGKNNIFSVLSATDWKPFTQRSGKDVQKVHKYSTHTQLCLCIA